MRANQKIKGSFCCNNNMLTSIGSKADKFLKMNLKDRLT